MTHNDYYKDRDASEVQPLAERLHEMLSWFFSDKNAECNKEWLGPMSNRLGYLNAYVDFAEGKYMVVEYPTNYKQGCSFWGSIRKDQWQAMSKASAMNYCTDKAKLILHIKDN